MLTESDKTVPTTKALTGKKVVGLYFWGHNWQQWSQMQAALRQSIRRDQGKVRRH